MVSFVYSLEWSAQLLRFSDVPASSGAVRERTQSAKGAVVPHLEREARVARTVRVRGRAELKQAGVTNLLRATVLVL